MKAKTGKIRIVILHSEQGGSGLEGIPAVKIRKNSEMKRETLDMERRITLYL